DGVGVIRRSEDVGPLAESVPDAGGIVFVPALVGLGAPYWDPYARGAILGLSRGTTAAHLARATIEAMAFQSRDLIDAMQRDSGITLGQLKADGGASVNDALMQFQADLLNVPVVRPVVAETTALGAGYLAGLAVGYWTDLADVSRNWQLDREFTPNMADDARDRRYRQWQRGVERSRHWVEN
ncbi:MAG TPA: FGGY-family carbohydrate kinase, partial [Pirellulales bacterium]|nr:FGGY-family carbohydrate kinase [Pirellulales bacterium]